MGEEAFPDGDHAGGNRGGIGVAGVVRCERRNVNRTSLCAAAFESVLHRADGAASLGVVHMSSVGGDDVDSKFVAPVIKAENVRRQTFTIIKREDRDRAHFDLVQPLWEFCIRHFAQYIQLGLDKRAKQRCPYYLPLAP